MTYLIQSYFHIPQCKIGQLITTADVLCLSAQGTVFIMMLIVALGHSTLLLYFNMNYHFSFAEKFVGCST